MRIAGGGGSLTHRRHRNADALHHVARQASPHLAAHLRHHAEPDKHPKPSKPLNDVHLHELASHVAAAVSRGRASSLLGLDPMFTRTHLTAHQQREQSYTGPLVKLPSGAKVSAAYIEGYNSQPSTLDALSIAALGVPGLGEAAGAALRGVPEALDALKLTRAAEATRAGAEASPGLRAADIAKSVPRSLSRAKNAIGASRGIEALRGETAAARVAQAAGKSVRYAVRHPVKGSFGASLGAQVPAAISSHDPGQLLKGLEGTGALANLLGGAGTAVSKAIPGVGGNALADLINLPAQVPPSLYLLGAGAFEAAKGRPQRLQGMFDYYKKTDPIPALISGHPGAALQRFGQHPVYSALELAGIKAGLGAAAGRVARTPLGEERPPYYVSGGVPKGKGALAPVERSLRQVRGTYSRDPVTRTLQLYADRRRLEGRPGPNVLGAKGQTLRSIEATPRQAQRATRKAVIAEIAAYRGVQVATRERIAHVMEQVKPARHSADVVQLMVQRALRSPATAVEDLRAFRAQLEAARPSLTSRAKLDANERSLATIDAALKKPDVEGIARATDEFLRVQGPLERGLIRRGLLAEEQARKAPLFNFARTYMGAEHGQLPEVASRIRELESQRIGDGGQGLALGDVHELNRLRNRPHELLREGKPLSTAEIEAEMRRQGVPFEGDHPAAGYVTGRPGGADRAGSYWRSFEQRPQLARQALSGEAAAKGTAELTWENLVATLQHQATTLGATAMFDRLGHEFGVGIRDQAGTPRPFKPATARAALENPADYGIALPPIRGGYGIWQTGHMTSLARELEAARRYGPQAGMKVEADPALGEQRLMEEAVQRAASASDPKGKTYIMPNEVIDLLRHTFAPTSPIERALQAGTTWLKRAWLPTNPGWLGGNIIDNYPVRTFGTGLGIGDIRGGARLGELTTKGQGGAGELGLERMTPGALFASVSKVQPRRLAESFEGNRIFGDVAKAGGTIARAPGIRTALKGFDTYARAVFSFEHKYIERLPQFAELNRASRRIVGQTRGQWRRAVKAQTPAVRDFVENGLRDTSYQRYFGERVAATYGNWVRMGPAERRFLSQVAPFWTWARAATKFVFLTMPREHPVITSMLAAAGQMTREERQKFGLDLNAEVPMPGWLQGSLPVFGGTLKLSNLSSYGFFANFPESYATSVFPQGANVIQNLKGLQWNGRQLVDANGKAAGPWQRVLTAATTIGSSFVPFYNVAHSGITKGPIGLSPAQPYPKSLTDYLRNLQNQQQISVPIKGVPQLPSATGTAPSTSPSTNPYDELFGSPSASSSSSVSPNPYDSLFK